MKEVLCRKRKKILMPALTAAIVFVLMLCLNISSIQAKATSGTDLMPEPMDNLTDELITTSYLTAVDGGYMRVYFDSDNGRIGIEYYDEDFCILSKTFLDMELSLWGGFYAGTDAYYIVEGQNNTAEDDTAEVIRVIKYSFDWKRLGAAAITSDPSLFGGEVRYPFDYGCVELTEYDGTLYIVTGHEGYVDAFVGQGHQGFLEIAVDEAAMTGEIVAADLWHSFAQYIENSGSELYVLEQSEGSRCTTLSKIDSQTQETTIISVLDYGGTRTSAQAVSCYASVDDMALSSDAVLCVGTSIDQSLYDSVTSNTSHNIYLTITPMSDFTEDATKVIWLTDFADDGTSFLGVKLTKVNDNRFMVSWEEYVGTYDMSGIETEDTLSEYELHYLFIDADGNVLSKEFTAEAPLSDCHPILVGSKLVYYASNSNTVDFYTIHASTGAFTKKVYRVAGNNITWEIEDGVLTFSGSGAITVSADVYYRYPVSSCVSWYIYDSSENAWKAVRSGVTEIVIRSGITSIPDGEFAYFSKLIRVTIGSGLKSIGSEAFAYSNNLSGIFVPDSVTSIGTDALWSGYYYTGSHAKVYGVEILCHSGSYAEAYAKENGIGYRIVAGNPDDDLTLTSCSVSYINNTMDGFKVVWNKVSGATGYYIYRRNADGTYSTTPTASVSGESTTEWIDPMVLTGGQDYTYKVAAYYEDIWGDVTVGPSGKTKTCKYLKGGEVESVANTTSGLKVTWTKVAGANGYYIFRKAAGESDYTQVATVTGSSKVSWTDTSSLTSGKNYTYKVSAIFTNSKGQVTKGGAKVTKTAKYLTPGKISSLSNTANGVYIKWTKVTGATGYYVYRKSSSGSYTLVKTITSVGTVSCTDTAIKSSNNTTYTYYIQPYFRSSAGVITKAAYTTKTIVRLVEPTISSLTNSASKTMTVKWGTKSGVTGYQVQYSASSSFSSGNKTLTITGASSSSKVISGLTKGKTYYVRIRTYKTVNGVTYYSAWTTKKSVKISK